MAEWQSASIGGIHDQNGGMANHGEMA